MALAGEFGFKVPDTAEDALCKRLRLHNIPWAEGFNESDIDTYAEFLDLAPVLRRERFKTLASNDVELYIELEISRVEYGSRKERISGITQGALERFPERYRSES